MVKDITMFSIFIFEAITVLQYLNSVFTSKGDYKKQIVSFVLGYLFLFGITFVDSVALNLLMYSIVNTMIAYMNYEIHVTTAAFHGIMLTSFMLISEMTVIMFSKQFYGISFNLFDRIDTLVLTAVMSKLLFFIICKMISKVASKEKDYPKEQSGFFLLAVLPIATLVVLFDIYSVSAYIPTGYSHNLQAVIGSLLLLFANLIVFGVYENVLKTNRENTILKLANQKQYIDHEYYKILKNQYNDSRMLIHDIKNHLGMLETFMANKDFSKAEHYIASVNKNYNLFGRVPISQNKMLDVICNQELEKCKLNRIRFEIQNEDINLNFIDDVDLCTILSNILENAIEACVKCPNAKKINLSFFKQNSAFTVISLINSCVVPPVIQNHCFVTTKEEMDNHGIGLLSVDRAIKKYGGQADYYYDEQSHTFHTNIIFQAANDI